MRLIFTSVLLLVVSLLSARELPSLPQGADNKDTNCGDVETGNQLLYWHKLGVVKYGSGTYSDVVYPSNHMPNDINNHIVNKKEDVYIQGRIDESIDVNKLFPLLVKWLDTDKNAYLGLTLLIKIKKSTKVEGHGVVVENLIDKGNAYEMTICSYGNKFTIQFQKPVKYVLTPTPGRNKYDVYGTLLEGGTPEMKDCLTMDGNSFVIDGMQIATIIKKDEVEKNMSIALLYMKNNEYVNTSKLHLFYTLMGYCPCYESPTVTNKDLSSEMGKYLKGYLALKNARQLKIPDDMRSEKTASLNPEKNNVRPVENKQANPTPLKKIVQAIPAQPKELYLYIFYPSPNLSANIAKYVAEIRARNGWQDVGTNFNGIERLLPRLFDVEKASTAHVILIDSEGNIEETRVYEVEPLKVQQPAKRSLVIQTEDKKKPDTVYIDRNPATPQVDVPVVIVK